MFWSKVGHLLDLPSIPLPCRPVLPHGLSGRLESSNSYSPSWLTLFTCNSYSVHLQLVFSLVAHPVHLQHLLCLVLFSPDSPRQKALQSGGWGMAVSGSCRESRWSQFCKPAIVCCSFGRRFITKHTVPSIWFHFGRKSESSMAGSDQTLTN